MVRGVLLDVMTFIFNFLSWTPFTLFYPLYASIQVMESGSVARSQQCLAYWVLFAAVTILELELCKLFKWFSFWPYAKGVGTLLLVIPYFRGASYIYRHFIRTYLIRNSSTWNSFLIPKEDSILRNQNDTFNAIDGNYIKNGQESESYIISQAVGMFDWNGLNHMDSCRETFDPTFSARNKYSWSNNSKEVQKEWSCALCLISTASEKCLKNHLQGRRHKSKEERLRLELEVMETRAKSSLTMRETSKKISLKNLNQIERVGFEWSYLLGPVFRSIRWCQWEKPEIGWRKLNTDGSINQENAGFGGILRDHRGDAICGFVSKVSRDDIFMVELWAVWRGLVLAFGLGSEALWVESDSMSVVKTINKEQPYNAKASRCLQRIWELLQKFEKSKVTHSWRETNRAADHLAKMVLPQIDVVLWPADFSDALRNIIKDDAEGRMYRRG